MFKQLLTSPFSTTTVPTAIPNVVNPLITLKAMTNVPQFSIAECGMPMQLARCPECGAPIGSTNHREVAG